MKIYHPRYTGSQVTTNLNGTEITSTMSLHAEQISAVIMSSGAMEIVLFTGTKSTPIFRVPHEMTDIIRKQNPMPGKYVLFLPNRLCIADNMLSGFARQTTLPRGYATPGMMAGMRVVRYTKSADSHDPDNLIRVNGIRSLQFNKKQDMVRIRLRGLNPFILPGHWVDWPDLAFTTPESYVMIVDRAGRILIRHESDWNWALDQRALVRSYDPNPDVYYNMQWAMDMLVAGRKVRNINWHPNQSDIGEPSKLLTSMLHLTGWIPGSHNDEKVDESEGSWNWAHARMDEGETVSDATNTIYLYKQDNRIIDQTNSFVDIIPREWVEHSKWKIEQNTILPL